MFERQTTRRPVPVNIEISFSLSYLKDFPVDKKACSNDRDWITDGADESLKADFRLLNRKRLDSYLFKTVTAVKKIRAIEGVSVVLNK